MLTLEKTNTRSHTISGNERSRPMDIEEQPYRTGTADKSESQGKRTILWLSVKTVILIALVVFIVVIIMDKNHYTVELVSSGNLPCEPFIKKSEDTIFVTPVSLINSKRAPISIQQISVQDVDANYNKFFPIHTDFKKSIHFYLIFGIVGTAVYQILVCYFTAHDRFSRLHSLIRSILKFAKQTTKKAANHFQTYCSCAAAGRRLFSCK